MDEPLSNLDAKLRVSTRSQISGLQRRLGTTTVYVTHDQVEAMTMGDRVAVLKDGVLQQLDTPRDLYDNPVNTFVATFIVAFGIVAVVGEWNEYLWPFLMSDDASVAPIAVGLTFLQQAEGVTNWGPVMAVTLLAMLPIMLIFLALQRQMIKGLTSGAVKG
jgi:energy-coupling factor transporter ATP-binding protein EcfA2